MIYIFDLGGVLIRNNDPLERVAEMLGFPDVERFLEKLREPFVRHCTGAISAEDFWREANTLLGTSVTENLWETEYRADVDPCVAEIIGLLRRKHRRVVAGTNTLDAHYRYHVEHGHFDLFDSVYASHLVGSLKPDPAFYRHILEAEDVAPSDALFVDDMEENVVAAREIGIAAVRFTDCATLRRTLRDYNGLGKSTEERP